MAIRLNEPPLDDTEKLLERVLLATQERDGRAIFLCPPGDGSKVIQRVRVMISRKRKDLERRGKRPKRFRLHSTIHPETHDGKRYDACVVWRSVTESHVMSEDLERMLSNG